ncbi:MAG: 50S ribosomal protein L11 methyltransferase [Syntrophobacterales bacterium]|nr:50S ribosomal protein L11 methyltransferase [Syntrophobacterales bacterium]
MEVRFLVPANMQEEAALYLTEFSGRGVILEDREEGGVLIRAFFPAEEFGTWQRQELQTYLDRLLGHGLYPVGLEIRPAAAEDWAVAWKEHFKPLKVTPRLAIRPPWEEYEPASGETVITIYPGMAFGTGRHPSTVLCLEALEALLEEGTLPPGTGQYQVLDVGTGSGILALAAARRGYRVWAIDVDPEAVAAALENVRLNALEELIWVDDTPLSLLRHQFPLILANLTAQDLLQHAESLAARLLSGGTLIVSGFLTEDLPALLRRFLSLGLTEGPRKVREDWVALSLRRP